MEKHTLESYSPRIAAAWAETSGPMVERREGTFVFADVSGFTALSEALSQQGREGAEIITDTIGSTFAAMLAPAYEHGGSLIKFGGDALLVWFEDEGHASRGAASASLMRSALRRVGVVPIPGASPVKLGVSQGVHSGTFNFHVVGDSHRELVLADPEISMLAKVEASAGSANILVSPATASHLPAHCLDDSFSAGIRLKRKPRAKKVEPPLPAGRGTQRLIPKALRKRLTEGDLGSEHRRAVVAFVKFTGTDGLTDGGETIHEFITSVQAEADQHEITFLSTDVDAGGFKTILAAGTPDATEDDAERLVRCCIEIAKRWPSTKTGIHRGWLFSGPVGPPYRQTFTVMGDTVNTAARVMGRCDPGRVLVTPEVLRASRRVFVTESVEPFAVKGKSEPLHAEYAIEATGNFRSTGRPELVGRSQQIEQVVEATRASSTGNGSVFLIAGDSGLGKTRLAEEISRHHEGASYWLDGDGVAKGTPWLLVREWITSLTADTPLIDAVPDSLADDARLVSDIISSNFVANPDADPNRPALAASRLLHELTPRGALVVIDGITEIDDSSRKVVEFIATSLEFGFVIVGTTRDTEFTLPGAVKMPLDPLTADETEALIRHVSPRPLLPDEMERIIERSGGNPLYCVSLSNFADVTTSDVSDLVAAKIDQLPAADRRLLRYLAVLGRRFSPRAVAGLDPTIDRRSLDRLDEFIEPSGATWQFRHPLTQEIAYATLPFRLRRVLHLTAGEFLSATDAPDPAELSRHFYEAQDWNRAFTSSAQAGSMAFDSYAFPEAALHLQRAVEAAKRTDSNHSTGDLWQKLGHSLLQSGYNTESLKAIKQAQKLTSSAVARAYQMQLEGRILSLMGEAAKAKRATKRAFDQVLGIDSHDAALRRARILGALARIHIDLGDPKAALKACDDGDREQGELSDPIGETVRTHHRSQAEEALGIPRTQTLERLVRLARETEDDRFIAVAEQELGYEALSAGDSARSVAHFQTAYLSSIRTGRVEDAAVALSNLGEVDLAEGQAEEAREKFAHAHDVFERTGNEVYRLQIGILLGRALAMSGDHSNAEVKLKDSIEALRALGGRRIADGAQVYLAEVALDTGRVDEARELLTNVEPLGLPDGYLEMVREKAGL